MSDLMLLEHRRAELERLAMGVEGCGCSDCQQLYKQIDLTPYGKRVGYYGDLVYITARANNGKERPEKTQEDEKPFKRTPENPAVVIENDAFKEITGKEGWAIGTLQGKPTPVPPTEPPDKPPSQEKGVAKVKPIAGQVTVFHKSPVKIKKVKKPVRHGIMGRPDKVGIVSRTTLWRRAKKLKKQQGVLEL